jgi:hypothetical protein
VLVFLNGEFKVCVKTAFAQRGRINFCHLMYHNDPNIVWKKKKKKEEEEKRR